LKEGNLHGATGIANEEDFTLTFNRGRLLGLLVLCLFASLALAACGGGGSSSSSTSESETSGEEESAGEETAVKIPPFEGVESEAASSYPEPKPGKFSLAYMNPQGGNEFLKTLGNAMKLETEKLGGTFTEVTAKEPNEQVTQMGQLVAQGVEGIAVFPLDPASLAPQVEQAKKAGVKLVTIDLNLEENDLKGLLGYESQILQRRDIANYLAAKYLAENLEQGAEVGGIEFAIKVPGIVYAIERAQYWSEKMGLNWVGVSVNKTDDVAGGEPAGTQLLNAHSDIKGVIAYNDPSAEGAYAAARSAGITDVLFGGENGGSEARQAIENERQTFSVILDPPSMGKAWAWGLYDLLQGTKVPPTVLPKEPILATKENVAEIPTWAEELEGEYGKSE
jgi:ribose transport system substrate-binding protein